MNKSNLYIKAGVILVLLLVFLNSIFPASENLRLGKDLAGGTSIVYALNLGEGDRAQDVVNQVIEVLQDRVNPTGTLDITFTPQSGGRIEITMPLPSPEVLAKRDQYIAALETLVESAVTQYELQRVLEAAPEERATLISQYADGQEQIAALFRQAAAAHDQRLAAEAAARAVEADDPTFDELEEEAARQWIAEDELIAQATGTYISRPTVMRVLESSNESQQILNTQGAMETELSPRAQGLDALTKSHPNQTTLIEQVEAAHTEYRSDRKTLDDPSDLMRLLRGAGVMTMHIAPSTAEVTNVEAMRQQLAERGPASLTDPQYAWFKINKIENWYNSQLQRQRLLDDPANYFEADYGTQDGGLVAGEFGGDIYILLWVSPELSLTAANGEWSIDNTGITQDDLGRPAVWFALDNIGSSHMRIMSGSNVGRSMAIGLDGEVYTAPVIQSRLGSGQIRVTGEFSAEEINYLTRVLSSGSLQAKLLPEPISINTLGPALGKDNLRRGLEAGLIAIVGVCIFMAIYYFFAGLVADFALLCNAIIILAVMSMVEASFTLPGIAGIVLTFGMAVDANVLIYERIREELAEGLDVRAAVRLGFDKAMSTIIDANITNLIVCFVLGYTATTEVKGFAVTLGIGIVATLFSCLFVTRVIFGFYTDVFRQRRLSMLTMVVPGIQRLLTPRVNWIRLRLVFVAISAGFVSLGLLMIYHQRGEMLDTEFRGGTAVTLQLRSDAVVGENGQETLVARQKSRQDVEDIIRGIGEQARDDDDLDNDDLTKLLGSLDVLTVGDTDASGVMANTFQIKTTVENAQLLSDAIILAFGEELDQKQPLSFANSAVSHPDLAPIYPITANRLGDNMQEISAERFNLDVSRFQGGAAILLQDIAPAVSVEDLKERVTRIRNQPDFADAAGRTWDIFGLEEDRPGRFRTAVLLVRDENMSYHTLEPEQWRASLAASEWRLLVEAMTQTTTLAGVQSFDSAIAQSFRATAIVSVALSFLGILIYIWLRFGSFRYSAAAIIALVHDVLVVIGLIAFAEVIYKQANWLATPLQIEPFKIDLGLVAALLTIIGYSLNDTIVILDRIRENRGRLAYASASVVNNSINQTVSRTLITSGTTFIAVLTLYIIGGTGIRSFSYALLCGVVVGTYSSIAVAAPLVYSRRADRGQSSRDMIGPADDGDNEEVAFAPATS